MSINILGGHAKGHALLVPHGDLIRPTSVMLRRRFFDAHQDMSGYQFVDLCAGSGAMGLEALSRGADSIFLNEFNSKVYSLLKKNCQSFSKYQGLGEINLHKGSCLDYIKGNLNTFDHEEVILFFDPPYELHDLYKSVLNELMNFENAKKVIETDRQKGVSKEVIESYGFKVKKEYKQGTSFIYILS